jgi:Rod binding domain-containing protein
MINSNVDISTLNAQSSFDKLQEFSRAKNDEKEIDRVAGEFQSMCYAHLVKAMFATTEDSPLWGDSHASGILRSMFIEAIAHSGGAESLNIRASIKKGLYQNMGVEANSETQNTDFPEPEKESINVLL